MALFQPDTLLNNRYRLVERVGAGGFSVVWKARDEGFEDTVVAVKIFVPDKGLDADGMRLFQREYDLTVGLNDNRLLRSTDYFVHAESPCLVFPYCQRGSLYKKMLKDGVLDERELARVIYQTAGALHYLHSQQPPLLHLDIKPDNILCSYSGDYLLADFGISSRMRTTLSRMSGTKAETIAFSPPERYQAQPQVTTKSDIFAFGVTLYEAATGDLPWDGEGGKSLVLGLPVPMLPEGFSPQLRAIVSACMALNPDERPSAGALEYAGKQYFNNGCWPSVAELLSWSGGSFTQTPTGGWAMPSAPTAEIVQGLATDPPPRPVRAEPQVTVPQQPTAPERPTVRTPVPSMAGNGSIGNGGATPRGTQAMPTGEKTPTDLLFDACTIGDANRIRELAQQGANLNALLPSEMAPIHVAAKYGHAEAIKVLISLGVSPDFAENHYRMTPMHYTAWFGRTEAAQALIDAGAKLDEPNKSGNTPLSMAAWYGNTGVGELLIARGVNLNHRNNLGETPLKIALDRSKKDIAQMLQQAGGHS